MAEIKILKDRYLVKARKVHNQDKVPKRLGTLLKKKKKKQINK